MPQQVPVSEILHPPAREAPRTVNIWDCGYYGYLWVHPSAVISILPGSPTLNISNTLQNNEVELVLITVPPSIHLVGVDYVWLNSWVVPTRSVTPEGVCDSYREIFRPYSSNRK